MTNRRYNLLACFVVSLVSATCVSAQSLTPTVTDLSPRSVTAGSAAFTLIVTGTNFVNTSGAAGSYVLWQPLGSQQQPVSLSTTFINSTQLRASVPASLITTVQSINISVFTTLNGDGGLTSRAFSFSVLPAPPRISSLSPASVLAGSPTFTLTVNGSNFGNAVYWRVAGSQQLTSLALTFTSATQLRATVPADLIVEPRSIEILVYRITEGSISASDPYPFEVLPSTPSINSVVDSATKLTSTPVCGPQFTLQVTGANFAAGAQVYWNSTLLAPAPGNNTSNNLFVIVPSSLISSVGALPSITVRNPAVGAQPEAVSPPFTSFIITIGKPVLESVTPLEGVVNTAVTLTITGSGFVRSTPGVAASVLLWTPTNSPSVELAMDPAANTFNGCTQFRVMVPAERMNPAGTVSLTVRNFPSTGATSTSAEAKTFTIRPAAVPAPTITQIDPASAFVGSPDITVTVSGTNFTATTTVTLGAQALTIVPGSISSTSLRVTIGRGLLSSVGTPLLQVSNGTGSASRNFSILALPRLEIPATANAGDQPDVSVTLPAAAATEYKDVEVSLNFVKASTVAGWGDVTNPQVVFANGPSPAKVTIPSGATTVKLPIAVGTVAGTITATIIRINGVSVSIPASTIVVAPEVVIKAGSVKITGASASEFTVQLDGYSTNRALTSVVFTFQAAAGTQLTGAGVPVTVALATQAASYFVDTAESRARGGNFHVSVPFNYTGSPDALGTVSAALVQGTQTSAPVTGSK